MEIINMDKSFVHLKNNGSVFASTERLKEGDYTVAFAHLTEYKQTHPDHWELHPNGDELIFLVKGKLQAECITIPGSEPEYDPSRDIKRLTINQGQSIIIPRGYRHRLLLEEESKMIVITKIEGTEHSSVE